MARQQYVIPPPEEVFSTIKALITRVQELIRSSERLKTTDVRSAFFLGSIAVEEEMQALRIPV
ncbi:hypothetical protein [Sulfobacillus harzensis]|uniref:Uncharacterized protein n=1 Tax=Sulfobacillus harzensis TaxID=2729629 RepID=A0A7Y0Q5L2_9FIRM|nr:hypothetical protein [Sulfobacillus harzensis]NMP25201.1 hypothetical protein [Sulfobacillus harzensis]